MARTVVKHGDTLVMCAITAEPIEIPFRWSACMGRSNLVSDGVQIHSWQWGISRDRVSIVKYKDYLRELCVQKRLNRSICRLDLDLGGPKEAPVQPPGEYD